MGQTGLLLEQIRKLDCDRCKLKTEHYLLTNEETVVTLRCLMCGQPKGNIQFVAESHKSYPADESRPVYVV